MLGSVATGKYVDVLLDAFGDGLRFPADFAGRGDMSRGGLMLRRVESGEELAYVPLAGAARRGIRPPKLTPRLRGGDERQDAKAAKVRKKREDVDPQIAQMDAD